MMKSKNQLSFTKTLNAVHGPKSFTLQGFINYFLSEYEVLYKKRDSQTSKTINLYNSVGDRSRNNISYHSEDLNEKNIYTFFQSQLLFFGGKGPHTFGLKMIRHIS